MGDVERLIVIALLTVIGCLIYRWHVGRHPWVNCGKCQGRSKEQHLGLRPFGHCSRCDGRGKRLRFAAWILGHDPVTGGRKR